MTLEATYSWDQVYLKLLYDVKENGLEINPRRGPAQEIVAREFTLENPRDRLLFNRVRDWNIFQAVGQWLWIMAGRDDLQSIEYYSPKIARQMSTDKLVLLGAYGPRLFGPAPYDQIPNAVQLLRHNPHSRKAVCVIYDPNKDRHQLTEEIPCTISLQFLIRNGQLHMITCMRSQDATHVLPYDVFIFTMLQEYVASLLERDLGDYVHFSGSLHLYERDRRFVKKIIDSNESFGESMPPMPRFGVEESLEMLKRFEERIRTDVTVKGNLNVKGYVSEAEHMNKYWSQIALVLLTYAARQSRRLDNLIQVVDRLDKPFRAYGERMLSAERGSQRTLLDYVSHSHPLAKKPLQLFPINRMQR